MRAAVLLLLLGLPLSAQAKAESAVPEKVEKTPKPGEDKHVETRHTWKAGNRAIAYTATAGFMPLRNEKDEVEARVFFVAYLQDGAPAGRPLTFAFNGGPGSASIWLHMGGLGPRRTVLLPDGKLPPAPYRAEDNPSSWLEFTDLVFVDPVGTGHSYAEKPDLQKTYWSYKGDVAAMAEFVRLFLTRNQRWGSPTFLAGESYGGTRAAALAPALADKGVGLAGISLISPALNFQAFRFTPGNELPYSIYLPAFAATAWYHHKLGKDLQELPLPQVLKAAEAFARGPYLQALWQGDLLQGEARETMVAQIARFSGLSPSYIAQANLRPAMSAYDQELLRNEGLSVGRLDSRLTVQASRGTAELPDVDALSVATGMPFASSFQDFLRRDLGFQSDHEYQRSNPEVFKGWDWASDNRFVDATAALAEGMRKNAYTQVFVATGFYDLATPYTATHYSLDHLGLGAEVQKRITYAEFESGHMMYIDQGSLRKLQAEAAAFYRKALGR